MKIAVVGTGYVGLVAGACFADNGNHVWCVDSDPKKIELLNQGKNPIYEPGLEELLKRNRREERLHFTTQLATAVASAEVVFLAVGTPDGPNGDPDMRYVEEAARQVGKCLKNYCVIVNKSTVPVGTANRVRSIIQQETQVEFDVVSNPEFLKEGAAIDDFLRPDRVVVGCDSERARRVMQHLYGPFVRRDSRILFMDTASAEMSKYAANAMLASRISFMNEIALLCERTGADVDWVRQVLGSDSRIGSAFLFPGVGYGGSCFPKDVRALIATAKKLKVDSSLLESIEATNQRQKIVLVEKAISHFSQLDGKRFAVWGLSFKPRTDDMRCAPSIEIIDGLLAKKATVSAYDPVAMDAARSIFGERIQYAANPYQALEGADALFLLTEWNEFRTPDFHEVKRLMNQRVLFDGRNLYQPDELKELGFTYYGIGRS